ncbi:MFS transporter [Anaerobacillus alkaliphilus]|uniref:MFS transporter n=1 Tax=Anaerobacillus alkaliphilus TaxID=1548597 RepID=A0A4Q0VVH0_9BACI|nr:MFS transporter [Anaerobacillus alkaliphilus]RXJ00737.1 MFS transporter [Anaerobacillus alkaliphilus]
MSFRNLQTTIKIRLFTDFITDLSQMAIFPFMAIYFSIQVGQGMAGIMLAVNILCSIVAGLFSGYLADQLGRKKVMIFALIIQVAALVIMALVNSPWFVSVWITYLMFLISNVSSGIINPAASAMIIDCSKEEERPYIYGLQYWSGNIAISIGVIIGAIFFESSRFLLFFAFALISLFTLIIIVFFINETMKPVTLVKDTSNPPLNKNIFTNYWSVVNDYRFMLFVIGTVFIFSLEFQLDKYIAVRLKEEFQTMIFGYEIGGIQMFSFILLTNTLIVVVATLHLTKWISKWNHKLILTIGLLIYSLSFSTLAFSNSLTILMLAALLFTLGELMYSPIRQTLLAGIIPEQSRASYMAVDNLALNVAMLLGSLGLTLGAYLSSTGMGLVYLTLGIGGLFCFRFALAKKEQLAVITNKERHLG